MGTGGGLGQVKECEVAVQPGGGCGWVRGRGAGGGTGLDLFVRILLGGSLSLQIRMRLLSSGCREGTSHMRVL